MLDNRNQKTENNEQPLKGNRNGLFFFTLNILKQKSTRILKNTMVIVVEKPCEIETPRVLV